MRHGVPEGFHAARRMLRASFVQQERWVRPYLVKRWRCPLGTTLGRPLYACPSTPSIISFATLGEGHSSVECLEHALVCGDFGRSRHLSHGRLCSRSATRSPSFRAKLGELRPEAFSFRDLGPRDPGLTGPGSLPVVWTFSIIFSMSALCVRCLEVSRAGELICRYPCGPASSAISAAGCAVTKRSCTDALRSG